MASVTAPTYYPPMQQPLEVEESRLIAGPIVCPVCWDHALERIDGLHLTARTIEERRVSRVLMYRCSHWHVFAVFEQAL